MNKSQHNYAEWKNSDPLKKVRTVLFHLYKTLENQTNP